MAYRRSDINPSNSITSILVLVLGFVALYFLAKGVFTILSWVAPVLLIITAILDYRTIIDYGKWLWNLLRKNPLMGVGAIVLTVVGFPIIAGFLFIKALFRKKIGQLEQTMKTERDGQFVDYEEMESTTYEPLELPTIEPEPEPKVEPRREKNDYEDMFD